MIMKFKKAPGHFIILDKDMVDNDISISYKAKGILAYLMGRPETWQPNLEEIAKHANDKIGSIKSGIQELKQAGYVQITRIRDDKSKKWIGWEWYVDDSYPRPKVENQLTDEKPKVKNKLSDETSSNKAKPTKTESQKTDFRKNDFDNNIDQDKNIEDKKREREEEEKASRAKSPQEEIYAEVFGEQYFGKLTIFQREQISILSDLELLRKTCVWWRSNNHKAGSIGRLSERYHEQEQKIQEEKSKPKSGQRESVFDHNLRILGIDPATLQQVQ